MVTVKNVKEYIDLEEAIRFIHGAWGTEENYPYFHDAIMHASLEGRALPHFYILLKDDNIIGCCGLITNDFNSRHDLYPWLSSLYIVESERGNQYGNLLMNHAEKEALKHGFHTVYLVTDHDGYYEKYGWLRIEDAIDLFSAGPTRVYMKKLV